MADDIEPVEVVEVAHEALLRQWDTLERWLRELATVLSASESIRRSANDWHRSNRDEALLVHTAHRLQSAEAVFSDERLEGRFDPVDGEYLAACRQRDQRELQEREEQLRRIAEQQSARAALQRRVTWGLSTAALVVLALFGLDRHANAGGGLADLPGADKRSGSRGRREALRPKPSIGRAGGESVLAAARTFHCGHPCCRERLTPVPCAHCSWTTRKA